MKKLYRSKKDQKFAGVCGGLAEYFGIDAVIVRLLFVLLTFTASGILIYIVCMIIIPENPNGIDNFNNTGEGPRLQ